jgi:hypothetical protein
MTWLTLHAYFGYFIFGGFVALLITRIISK